MSKSNENLPKKKNENFQKIAVEHLSNNLNEPWASLSPSQNESLHEISSSFMDSFSHQGSNNVHTVIEHNVTQGLMELKSITSCNASNKEAIMSFIVPKVMAQLESPSALTEELQTIKTDLKTCKLYLGEVNKDLADIFLDLHYIYKKLEVKSKKNLTLSKKHRERLWKSAHEAETFQERSKHFLSNDPRELIAMFEAPKEQPN
ncbi:uncharacterized protein LOC117591313 isoform X2 [Drosophila guanche]|uniref:Uncharacterized protein n=2 Tax=Drosophila guanche TaxID=7266 RepID=A0A3B0K6N6_DROGU|nr:uncharacterized protein LOC117591313 isoform X2 [Drosophila guanche]SPP89784.1 Hypothetical predicted protein [Drosophila guanche]